MLETWKKLSEGLVGSINIRSLRTAFIVLSAVLLIWAFLDQHGPLNPFLDEFYKSINIFLGTDQGAQGKGKLEKVTLFFIILAALFILFVSTFIVDWLIFPVLRFLEGYWPFPLTIIQVVLVHFLRKKLESDLKRKYQIAEKLKNEKSLSKNKKSLSKNEKRKLEDEYDCLDKRISTLPAPDRLLPTRLGNILRAAEDYAYSRYGLHTFIVWQRLWLLIPEETKKEIREARQKLDQPISLMIWIILFSILSICLLNALLPIANPLLIPIIGFASIVILITWLELPISWSAWMIIPLCVVSIYLYYQIQQSQQSSIGLVIIVFAVIAILSAHSKAIAAARLYGDLIRSAFDLYHLKLYQALNWPLPTSPAEEQSYGYEFGYELSIYLRPRCKQPPGEDYQMSTPDIRYTIDRLTSEEMTAELVIDDILLENREHEHLTSHRIGSLPIQHLIEKGLISPPPHSGKVAAISETELLELANEIGSLPSVHLSEIIIESRRK